MTEDKYAVEGVDQGEEEVRHHDEEHEGPDHLVELVFEKGHAERMLYQICEGSQTEIQKQRCWYSVIIHFVSPEDLREVQVDGGLFLLHSDPFIKQFAELLHGSGDILADGIDDVIFLVPGVELGSSLYEEPHVLLAGRCEGKDEK